ncbi:hypothetical protein AB1484_31950 [Parafrankia sp. FMc6]|uniref:hypothetical protein n=1 Tax=Parafrankia soli TaxID=2599596 RepID=UPI0034D72399
MTGQVIPLSDLEPTADDREFAERVYARRSTLDGIDRAAVGYGEAHGETLADALTEENPILAAVAVRTIVAHARAARARRAELAAAVAVEGEPLPQSRVPGAAWAAWRRSTVTPTDGTAGGEQ